MQKKEFQPLLIDDLVFSASTRDFMDEDKLEDLSVTIRENGLLTPILCTKQGNKYLVIKGKRRAYAAKMAGLKMIDAIVVDVELEGRDVLIWNLTAHVQREDLRPMELARGIRKLMEVGKLNATIAAGKIGLSPAAVTKSLALLTLPENIQQLVDSREIPASAAYELTRIEDLGLRAALTEQLAAGRLTRDQLVGMRRAGPQLESTSEGDKAGRVTAQLGEGRIVTVAGPRLDLEAFISTLEELLQKARRARPTGIALSTFMKTLKDQCVAVLG